MLRCTAFHLWECGLDQRRPDREETQGCPVGDTLSNMGRRISVAVDLVGGSLLTWWVIGICLKHFEVMGVLFEFQISSAEVCNGTECD